METKESHISFLVSDKNHQLTCQSAITEFLKKNKKIKKLPANTTPAGHQNLVFKAHAANTLNDLNICWTPSSFGRHLFYIQRCVMLCAIVPHKLRGNMKRTTWVYIYRHTEATRMGGGLEVGCI